MAVHLLEFWSFSLPKEKSGICYQSLPDYDSTDLGCWLLETHAHSRQALWVALPVPPVSSLKYSWGPSSLETWSVIFTTLLFIFTDRRPWQNFVYFTQVSRINRHHIFSLTLSCYFSALLSTSLASLILFWVTVSVRGWAEKQNH